MSRDRSPTPVDVTVVMATKDRCAYLRQALDGVLRQEEVDLELIVIDDGSSDGTPALLASLDDPRLTVIRHEQPTGTSLARNKGIAAARGAWTAFLDDDDLWAPQRLRAQLDGAGDAVLAWCGQLLVDRDRAVVGVLPAPDVRAVVRHIRDRSLIGGPSAVIARTDALRAVGGFADDLRALNDWDLWLALTDLGPGHALADLLVGYTVHETNMFRSDPGGQMRDLDRLMARRPLGPRAAFELLDWLAAEARARGDRQTAAWALRERARRYGRRGDAVRARLFPLRGPAAEYRYPARYVPPAWLQAYGPVPGG